MAGLEISAQFEQFTRFASDALMHNDTKAIARLGDQIDGPDGPRQIDVTTDDKVYALKRSKVNKDANDATRDLFLKAVADTFKGEKNIPEGVLKALNMKDFKSGKPLTARRIDAVRVAIMHESTKLRDAEDWLAPRLKSNGLVPPSPPSLPEVTLQSGQKRITQAQYDKARGIIAKWGNTMHNLPSYVRDHLIDKILDMVVNPEFEPHAEELFVLIPRNIEELRGFNINDLKDTAPARLFTKV